MQQTYKYYICNEYYSIYYSYDDNMDFYLHQFIRLAVIIFYPSFKNLHMYQAIV